MSLFKALGVAILWLFGAAALLGLVLLIPRRTRRFARYWLALVVGAYVALGLPVVANAIADSLPQPTQVYREGDPIGALIVFDGDNRRGRLSVTLRMLAGRPAALWLLTDSWLAGEIEAAGHPRTSFQRDGSTLNTRDQMEWVATFIQSHPGVPVGVVASRLQAPRVAALADARKLAISVLVSPIDDEPPASGWRRWVPSYVGFRTSRDALYEHAALWYYRRQGWIR